MGGRVPRVWFVRVFVRAGGGGHAPFFVLGVVAQGFVEVDFNKYFARWGL